MKFYLILIEDGDGNYALAAHDSRAAARAYRMTIEARDKEHALEIARKKRAELIAKGRWP